PVDPGKSGSARDLAGPPSAARARRASRLAAVAVACPRLGGILRPDRRRRPAAPASRAARRVAPPSPPPPRPAARPAGPARAAVGRDHVAVDQERALAEGGQIHDGAQAPSDQTLDLVRAPARAAALALDALARAARQHGVLRRDPAPALAAQEGRHALLHGRRAYDPRRAHLDQHRALGGREEAGREPDRPEL